MENQKEYYILYFDDCSIRVHKKYLTEMEYFKIKFNNNIWNNDKDFDFTGLKLNYNGFIYLLNVIKKDEIHYKAIFQLEINFFGYPLHKNLLNYGEHIFFQINYIKKLKSPRKIRNWYFSYSSLILSQTIKEHPQLFLRLRMLKNDAIYGMDYEDMINYFLHIGAKIDIKFIKFLIKLIFGRHPTSYSSASITYKRYINILEKYISMYKNKNVLKNVWLGLGKKYNVENVLLEIYQKSNVLKYYFKLDNQN